jgi:hypothetical protein
VNVLNIEELSGGIPQPQDLNLSKLRGEAQSRVNLKGQPQVRFKGTVSASCERA